jgi:hypothetical protein
VRILYAVLCESAASREDGRLDLQGVFHQLYAPGFPAQQDRMTLVVVIEWDAGEEGKTEFRIDLLDPDATPALTINGHTDVGPSPAGEAPPQTRLVMPLADIVFPAAGSYDFVLHVGDDVVRLAPLHLVENPDAR